jgi:PAS domain S-box-containing protein
MLKIKQRAPVSSEELNAYWKTVVDTIQEGVMIVNPEGVIISVNKAFENLTGYALDELIGNSCSTLNCTSCKVQRSGDPEHWCTLFHNGLLEKQRCVLMRRDSSYVHILKNASVLRDTRGKVIGAVETMTDITELLERETTIEAFKRELNARDTFHGIIGISASMQRIFDLITNASDSDAPLLVLGESGTGKELIAQAVHECSGRKDAPYIKVNCASLNESLLESELFGHVKGAFTGAHQDRKGRFEAADGGSIFLDEIGDLPMSTQVKLLRVLEEKTIERVGDNQSIAIDVRIITATNRDLADMVRKGLFREDLFYRINVIPLNIPPVRDRTSDIPLLAESFFRKLQLKSGKNIQSISSRAMDLLMRYSWPGNVRELRSTFEYAFVTCQSTAIEPTDLPPVIQQPIMAEVKEEIGLVPKVSGLSINERREQELIAALEQTRGNQTRAAEILGVSRVTVWNRMKRYGLQSNRS